MLFFGATHLQYLLASLTVLFISLISGTTGQFHTFGGQGLGILPGAGAYHGGPFLHQQGNLHYPPSQFGGLYGGAVGGSRHGQGYVGNGGIGIKQTDANLADLYGLPRQLAQAPPPRPLQVPQQPQLFDPFLGAGLGGGGYPGPQQQQLQYGPQLPTVPGFGPAHGYAPAGYLG